jgi:biotin carboxyl carrier protein
MQYEIEVGGTTRRITIVRTGATFAVTIDGQTRHVDAARIGPHTLSLIVDNVWPVDAVVVSPSAQSHLTVTLDGTPVPVAMNGRRHGRRDDAAHAGSGPQKLLAPMPGKVVRVLVKAGDAVAARQPLVVIEAMKMENELRAGRDGTVAEVHAHEGQSVDAGALLVIVQ